MSRSRAAWRAACRTFAAAACVASVGILASGTASAGTPTVELDHFLCYAGSASLRAPNGVLLVDELQPRGFSPQILSVSTHCNPTNMAVPHKIDKESHPNAHALCWTLLYSFEPLTVAIKNQFGAADMTSGNPTSLCLPTWTSYKGFPKEKTVAPPKLDHLACYQLTKITGAYDFKPPSVSVEDQFSRPKYHHVVVGTADLLCVPAKVIVNGAVYTTQGTNDPSLVCFASTPTALRKHVDDEDQFGHTTVTLSTRGEQLCIPSTVNPITTHGGAAHG